jgi:diguanylate cyclase (GGDEF)-like protein
MAIQVSEGDARRLVVNATRIEDETGALQGAIVTFDDVTNLHNLNEELYHSIEQLRSFQSTIETQNRQLALLATRDPLTDCLNRRAFFAEFETALIESANQSKSAALMMIDVDHFKSVNDRFGHAVGDKVLINLVETLNAVCNENDLVGRYGGEEFCIVARGRNDEETEAFANEVCLRVAAAESWLPNGQPVTISIGLVACRDVGVNTKDCAKRGDEALYAAKVSGRNRVVNWRTIAAALPANSEFLEELVKSKVRS